MSGRRFIVFGADGQVGWELQRALASAAMTAVAVALTACATSGSVSALSTAV